MLFLSFFLSLFQDTYIVPSMELAIPVEYKRWAKPIVRYSVKCVCISVSFFLQRMISAVHSAVKGGIMVSRNVLEYLSVMKILPKAVDHEETLLDEIAGGLLAVCGLLFQLKSGYGLPFPLSVLLLPFTLLERLLLWFVTY